MALVDMLLMAIEKLDREDVRTHSHTMVDTFLVMLDYRTVKQTVSVCVTCDKIFMCGVRQLKTRFF